MQINSCSLVSLMYFVFLTRHFTSNFNCFSKQKNILLFSEEKLKTKPKKAKQSLASKRLAQAIPLDATGRPIFPIALGGLKVHSLGEVSK